jgi:hypothetical protein
MASKAKAAEQTDPAKDGEVEQIEADLERVLDKVSDVLEQG